MSDGQPAPYARETAVTNLFVHQLVLSAIAGLATPSESAEMTRKLGPRLESDIASLMRLYWDNQGTTVFPRIAAGLQHVVDKLNTAEDLTAIVGILVEMSQIKAPNEDSIPTSEPSGTT